jgi:hypothetical protein
MLDTSSDPDELHKVLILVFHGTFEVDFAHAACFIRKDKQLLLLDCKNQGLLVYPRRYPSQHNYETVNAREDIEGEHYHQWDLYYIEKRVVDDDQERQLLHNRMMKMLTGDSKYGLASMSLNMSKINEERNRKMQVKHLSSRRSKRKLFKSRPDRKLAAKRKSRQVDIEGTQNEMDNEMVEEAEEEVFINSDDDQDSEDDSMRE